MNPAANDIPGLTDHYFKRTKEIVGRYGDVEVTYAVFMRRPVLAATRLAVDWLKGVMAERGQAVAVKPLFEEGAWVGAGEPMLLLTGSFFHLVDCETILLQKLGAACVAAYNAYQMCVDLPEVAFLAMEARHCAGAEMHELMGYAASVGSEAAKRAVGATGFVGTSTDLAAPYFGTRSGKGTMPHALIGYAGSTLRAAEMFHETYPDDDLILLPDFFGHEVSDTLEVCRRFPALAAAGRIHVRLDTHGGRFIEGLDPQSSYAVLERHVPKAIRGYRTEAELKILVGTGVSAAAIWHTREQLDKAGFERVGIIGSSGFGPAKCKVMAYARAPLSVVGTGSFLPADWGETYATADVIAYGDQRRVKIGREFLWSALDT
ncbi:MAG: nicotinate phosphoribosyltransferase [Magnetospirillum sp.]|nr:nicotinate phosphoribosyltransferase [Magnetospirillum sp.]